MKIDISVTVDDQILMKLIDNAIQNQPFDEQLHDQVMQLVLVVVKTQIGNAVMDHMATELKKRGLTDEQLGA